MLQIAHRSRLINALLSPLLVLASVVLALTLAVAPATAGGGELGGDGTTGGSNPPGGGPPPPSSNPGGGGDDTTGSGTTVPAGYFSERHTWADVSAPPVWTCVGNCPPRTLDQGVAAYYNGKCKGGTEWGPYDGVSSFADGNEFLYIASNETLGHREYQHAYYNCLEPPHYEDRVIMCAKSIGAVAYGPYGNPNTAAGNPLKTFGPNPTAFMTTGNDDLALCRRSYQQNFSVALDEYGRYKLVATGYQTACTYRHYTTASELTGDKPADYIKGCFGSFPVNENEFRAQLFCPPPGFTLDWSGNHAFTPEECLNASSSQGVWSCGPNVTKKPSFNGRLDGPVEVLDDGKDRQARWTTVAPTGVRNIRDRQTRMQYLEGSPFRAGYGQGASNQPFVATPTMGAWADGWRAKAPAGTTNTIFNLNFQAAGSPGNDFTARAQWKFTGEFKFKTVTITSINWQTGEVETDIQTVWKTMTATCSGKPLHLAVQRARNSNG